MPILQTAELVASGGFGGGRPAAWAATGRPGGVSRDAFGGLNLAEYVGDEPSAVAANRALLASWAGVEELRIVRAVHGSRVGTEDLDGCDGAVSAERGVALVAMAADCATVGLADPEVGVIGVLHCGWRGLVGDTEGDIVTNTADRMRALGADRIRAVLGPAICAACYPVDAERADLVVAAVPEAVSRADDGSWRVDVRAGVRARLAAAGIGALIEVRGCTVESPLLYSNRGADGEPTGRHGMLVRSW